LLTSKGVPSYENENKTMKQLVVHRDYSNMNCQIEISAVFHDIFGIFAVFLNVYLFHDFSRNPGLKTMVYSARVR
jgi:uridylate kinase